MIMWYGLTYNKKCEARWVF